MKSDQKSFQLDGIKLQLIRFPTNDGGEQQKHSKRLLRIKHVVATDQSNNQKKKTSGEAATGTSKRGGRVVVAARREYKLPVQCWHNDLHNIVSERQQRIREAFQDEHDFARLLRSQQQPPPPPQAPSTSKKSQRDQDEFAAALYRDFYGQHYDFLNRLIDATNIS